MRLAHQFAIENENITADMVEVSEFPHLVEKYQISGVPKTIINETGAIIGHVPEEDLLDAILQV